MKLSRFFILLALSQLLVVSNVLTQYTRTVTCTRDTYISRTDPTGSYCVSIRLFVGDPSGNEEYKALLYFPTSIYNSYYNKLVRARLFIRADNAPFDADACRINGLGTNWNDCTINWDNSAQGSQDCNPEHWAVTSAGYQVFTVTDVVYQWLSGGYQNEGLVLVYPNVSKLSFYSKETASPPWLELEFSDSIPVSVSEQDEPPSSFSLEQNYPNPFNLSTKIDFVLPKSDFVNVTIYDVSGRVVRKLFNGVLPLGNHSLVWDGRDESGVVSSTGLYFYEVKLNETIQTKRMLLLK